MVPPKAISSGGIFFDCVVALAWVTAVPYLLVGSGVRSPLRLATADAVHLYVGSAMVVLLVAKVARVGVAACSATHSTPKPGTSPSQSRWRCVSRSRAMVSVRESSL